jgi:hypothetical protein
MLVPTAVKPWLAITTTLYGESGDVEGQNAEEENVDARAEPKGMVFTSISWLSPGS